MQIIPSLLTDDQLIFINSLGELQGACDIVQIDIADGVFVDGKTLNAPELAQMHAGELSVELHLMAADPAKILAQWSTIPAAKRVYIHIEIEQNIPSILSLIKQNGWQAGLAIKPETPTSTIKPYLDEIDAVLFLGVEPGGQGRPFQPSVLSKMKEFKQTHPHMFCALDGGVNETTLSDIVSTGVEAVCPGSAVFGNERSPKENIAHMMNIIAQYER